MKSKDCKHVSKKEWNSIMKSMVGTDSIKSVLLIDGLNAKPLYVPSHEFKYFYAYNEFTDSPPLFFDNRQYLNWFRHSIKENNSKTYYLRIHVCDPLELMRKVVIKFKNLSQINCHFFILTNDCIEFLVQNCLNLKAINFENSIGIRLNQCVLLAKLPKLKHLNLMASDVYEESLEYLLKNCPNLKSLNISNNSGITGHCLTWINRSIKRLDLRDCWGIESQQIIGMARLGLNSLKEFLINSGISDESLVEICTNCPNISHLNISFDYIAYNDIYGRRVLTDLGFSAIGKLVNLNILTLRHVGKLTDKSLQNILKGCQNLTQLVINVRHRHQLTDQALTDIGLSCEKLNYLESVHNHFIGKSSLRSISRMKNLEALVLRGNELVDNDVIRVISECKELLFLNLDGCSVKDLVLLACIQRASELQPKNQIFRASLIRTRIDRSALNENVLPPNLRIRVSGPNNLDHFTEFNGKDILLGSLLWFFPHYWVDFN